VTVREFDAGGDVGVADLAPVVAAQPNHHVRDVLLGQRSTRRSSRCSRCFPATLTSRPTPLGGYNSRREFRDAQVQPTDVYDPAGYERRLFEATKL
jgi:hypothetical protein